MKGTPMARKRKENISEVMFSYVGTDEQFDDFLKMLVHDYLSVNVIKFARKTLNHL